MVCAILADLKTHTRRIVKEARHPDWGNIYTPGVIAKEPEHVLHRMCPYGAPGDRLWVKETWVDAGGMVGPEGHGHFVRYAADGSEQTVSVSREIFDSHLAKAIERQRKYCPPMPTDELAPDYFKQYEAHQDWLTKQYEIQRPSIFMPRWASRITLEVTGVRVEQLREINEADAKAEGVERKDVGFRDYRGGYAGEGHRSSARDSFRTLWDSINAEPTPVKGDDGRISHYVSYPWENVRETRTHRGKLWHVIGNPWVWVIEFRRLESEVARA